MLYETAINKPEPIILTGYHIEVYNRNNDVMQCIKTLEAGGYVLITDYYSDGLSFLKELQKYLNQKLPNKTFIEQRAYRSEYHKLSNLVLLKIEGHKLAVKKAPSIGWLKKLYPKTADFFLTFPQVQGLNSSWQWYQNGISIPVMRNKLHPFYGTYFPTRFDHLILFDNWLSRYKGPKKSAIDVGIGSGILSFQLIKHGFQKVYGTDINPNAIVGLTESVSGTKLSRKIELDIGHIFGKWEKQTELIVFNPPWLPESGNSDVNDRAIYYNENLFHDFFKDAKTKLLPEGKLVIIFSNLAQLTNVTAIHPIQEELAKGCRFQLEKCLKRKVKAASNKTKRDQHWRTSEEVELWVLIHK